MPYRLEILQAIHAGELPYDVPEAFFARPHEESITKAARDPCELVSQVNEIGELRGGE